MEQTRHVLERVFAYGLKLDGLKCELIMISVDE